MTDFYRARACFSNLIRRCVQSSCRRRVSFNICLRRRRCISLHPPPRSSVTARENQCPPPLSLLVPLGYRRASHLTGTPVDGITFSTFLPSSENRFCREKVFWSNWDCAESICSGVITLMRRITSKKIVRKNLENWRGRWRLNKKWIESSIARLTFPFKPLIF